jgi:ABC-type nitrate/sulfonate/bicarbonate transport system substrate-binding protein
MLKRIALPISIAAIAAMIWVANGLSAQQSPLQKIKINFPTRSAGSWPLFIAREGGYYQKYGLDVDLVFGSGNVGVAMIASGEAVMTNSSMEQALQASSRDGSLVSMGSMLNKGPFSLMAAKGINSVKELKGKRVAVSQLGDAPYNYTVALLGKFGLKSKDVEWISVGTDATARATALLGGRADATLLTAPQYFRVEEQGFRNLANLADYDDVYASNVYLFTKAAVARNPKLPELIIMANAEAIKRFYDDKAFAIKAYIAYDKQTEADVARIYDTNFKQNLLERIPYVMANAVTAIKKQAEEQGTTQLHNFNVKTVVDNSAVDRLVKEGFFEKLFGSSIKAEIDRKSKMAFR